MARDYTADELIKSVQQRAQIALAARDFGTVQILRLFNEEIDGYLVPFVAQRKLEFWVESATVAVTAGTSSYPIPADAMGGKLRALALLQGGNPYPLDQIDLSAAVQIQGQQLQGSPPSRYYFMGNNFILFPPPSGNATVIVYYYRRPSQLVLQSQIFKPSPNSVGGVIVTFTYDPTSLTPFQTANYVNAPDPTSVPVDLVSNSPGFDVLASADDDFLTGDFSVLGQITISFQTTAAALAAYNIIVGSSYGAFICLPGTSPVITGCPADIINLITQEVALKVAEAKGGTATIANLSAGLARAEKSAGWTVQQRNDGAARKLSAFPEDATGTGWPWG